MLTLAQLIKCVLDESYEDISGNESTKDKVITEAIAQLSSTYRDLMNPDRIVIDYSSTAARFAYLYKYTIAHADYIKQLIDEHEDLAELFVEDSVTVASLGGGPGSDLLGILKFMLIEGSTLPLTCYLFDRERAWADSWSEVAKVLKTEFQFFPIFSQMDVTDHDTWHSYKKFYNSDLFTLSFFISEIWSIKDQAEPFFEYCFSNAKPGSLFLYVDNNDKNNKFVNWYDEMMDSHGIEILFGESRIMAFDTDEEKLDLEPYFTKFGWPKRESNVTFRIARKV